MKSSHINSWSWLLLLNALLTPLRVVLASPAVEGMQVLVIGGTYFLGEHAVKTLLEKGAVVTVFNRGTQKEAVKRLKALGASHIKGDRNDVVAVKRLFNDHKFDLVVDMVMFDMKQMFPLISALREGKDSKGKWRINHYIFVSSTSQYEVCQDESKMLFGKHHTDTIDESDFKVGACQNTKARPYALSKHQIHHVLLNLWEQEQFPFTTLLIPGMSGPNSKDGGKSDTRHLVNQLVATAQLPELVLHPASRHRKFRITAHCQHLADAVVAAAENREAAIGQHFHIAMAEALTLEDYLKAIAKSAGLDLKVAYGEQHGYDGPFYGREPLGTQWGVLSVQKACDKLGWKPLPIGKWMPDTVQWWSVHWKKHFGKVKAQLPSAVSDYWAGRLHDEL